MWCSGCLFRYGTADVCHKVRRVGIARRKLQQQNAPQAKGTCEIARRRRRIISIQRAAGAGESQKACRRRRGNMVGGGHPRVVLVNWRGVLKIGMKVDGPGEMDANAGFPCNFHWHYPWCPWNCPWNQCAARGTNPAARGTNPVARGTNPVARGTNPVECSEKLGQIAFLLHPIMVRTKETLDIVATIQC
eukprot:gene11746-biopygen355